MTLVLVDYFIFSFNFIFTLYYWLPMVWWYYMTFSIPYWIFQARNWHDNVSHGTHTFDDQIYDVQYLWYVSTCYEIVQTWQNIFSELPISIHFDVSLMFWYKMWPVASKRTSCRPKAICVLITKEVQKYK